MKDTLYVVTSIEKTIGSYIFDDKKKAWNRFYVEVAWMINKHGTTFTMKDEHTTKCYEWSDGAKLTMGFGYISD